MVGLFGLVELVRLDGLDGLVGLVLLVELVVLVGFVGAVRTIEIVDIEIKKVLFASIRSGKKNMSRKGNCPSVNHGKPCLVLGKKSRSCFCFQPNIGEGHQTGSPKTKFII